jgi:hypothetical protein
LNRAEWIKFLALFFNKENQTNFAAVNASYHQLKAPAVSNGSPPVIAFIQKFSYLMQGDSYQISFAPYKLDYIEARGLPPPPPSASLPPWGFGPLWGMPAPPKTLRIIVLHFRGGFRVSSVVQPVWWSFWSLSSLSSAIRYCPAPLSK